jgi:hypothetical protein
LIDFSASCERLSDETSVAKGFKINDTEKAEEEQTAIAANEFPTLPVLHLLRAKKKPQITRYFATEMLPHHKLESVSEDYN